MYNKNESISIVIVDDERHGREIIKKAINDNFPYMFDCHEADSVASAIETIKKYQPSIVFLDIELSDGTGFDALDAFEDISFKVIFATAYNYYAIRAIKFSALDYLLKPIDTKELVEGIKKAVNKISNENSSKNYNLLKEQKNQPVPEKIALPVENGYEFLKINDIIKCQAESNYTKFYLVNGKSLLICHTLKSYEALLSDFNFCRVHNSFLINMFHVSKYIKGKGGYAIMSDNSEVEISIRKKEQFLHLFAKL